MNHKLLFFGRNEEIVPILFHMGQKLLYIYFFLLLDRNNSSPLTIVTVASR